MSKDARYRNWVFVAYPESAPENWRSILDEWHIPWIESPLHDRDVNPGTGELKKPHWHIALAADSLKSYSQILEVTKSINATIPQPIHSMRGQIRYFAHLDNPEKVQYAIDDIIPHQGADLEAILMPTRSQRYKYIADMLSWCRENDVIEFQDLVDYAITDHPDDWFPMLCDSCAYIVSQYLKSARMRSVKENQVDC